MDSLSIRVAGCSHHASDVRVRERLAFCKQQATTFLLNFHSRWPTGEAVLLSTCNRTEFYTVRRNSKWGPNSGEMKRMLAEACGVDAQWLAPHLFDYSGEDAVRHLFSVTASLDSMVIGETEILGQVKQAYQLAAQLNRRMPVTHRLFQTAVKVARRVACETDICANRVSIPSIAIGGFARQVLGNLADKRILVIGAGEMATETLKYVTFFAGRQIAVVNRTFEAALELANSFRGVAVAWDQLPGYLQAADLIISTTGSTSPIITDRMFAPIDAAREGRPLFILDLAIPRDFEPAVGQRENVHLYSMDHLQTECERNRFSRQCCLPRARKIIDDETSRMMTALRDRFRDVPGNETCEQSARVGSNAMLPAGT